MAVLTPPHPSWIPAFAGMTGWFAGMTVEVAASTVEVAASTVKVAAFSKRLQDNNGTLP